MYKCRLTYEYERCVQKTHNDLHGSPDPQFYKGIVGTRTYWEHVSADKVVVSEVRIHPHALATIFVQERQLK